MSENRHRFFVYSIFITKHFTHRKKNSTEMFWNTDKKRTFAVRLLPQKQPDVATATALWPGLRWKARQ